MVIVRGGCSEMIGPQALLGRPQPEIRRNMFSNGRPRRVYALSVPPQIVDVTLIPALSGQSWCGGLWDATTQIGYPLRTPNVRTPVQGSCSRMPRPHTCKIKMINGLRRAEDIRILGSMYVHNCGYVAAQASTSSTHMRARVGESQSASELTQWRGCELRTTERREGHVNEHLYIL